MALATSDALQRLYASSGGDTGFAAVVRRKDAGKEASAVTRGLLKFGGPDPGDSWVNKNLKFLGMPVPAVRW